mmetsp:Transcript_53269/g.165118  ORF Transcript_53269/g.165118 Transcript_53269/m.165118 type:complete len:357 (-) Transcript_53269:14-1084(-)
MPTRWAPRLQLRRLTRACGGTAAIWGPSAARVRCGPLSAVHVLPGQRDRQDRRSPLVVLHGAYHGAWYARPLQELLAAEYGVESFALDLNKGALKTGPAHMRDVRAALAELDLDRPTLFGHSQGGVFVQQLLHEAASQQRPHGEASTEKLPGAAVFCATMRLGSTRQTLAMQKHLMLDDLWGLMRIYRDILLRGRVMRLPDLEYTRRVFLNPETEVVPSWTGGEAEACGGTGGGGRTAELPIEGYYRLLDETGDALPCHLNYGFLRRLEGVPPLDAPALHSLAPGGSGRFRSLAVHAENDVIFGPECADSLVQDFGSELLVCRGQAHCLVDAGWQDAFARPLGEWLSRDEGGAAGA